MRSRATDIGMTRWVFGKVGSVDEWLPLRIHNRGRIAVLVPQPDRRDRTPKVVKVLAVPARDLSIGHGGLSQRIHPGGVASVLQVVVREVPQGVLPQHRTAIGPEIANFSLLSGTYGAGQRTHCLRFVVVVRP